MQKLLLSLILLFGGCAMAPPSRVTPITGFELNRYLGQWYEIARLDHSFERGLSNVSAHYGLRDDGGVAVLNRGYDDRAKVWKDAFGNLLADGDSVTLVKDLKLKGSSAVIKVGTKVKNIRLVEGDHDIDCKIEGFGAMQLKSEFVKKS